MQKRATGDIQSISAEIETSYDNAYSEADSRYLVEGYYPSISLGSYENGEFVQKTPSTRSLQRLESLTLILTAALLMLLPLTENMQGSMLIIRTGLTQ